MQRRNAGSSCPGVLDTGRRNREALECGYVTAVRVGSPLADETDMQIDSRRSRHMQKAAVYTCLPACERDDPQQLDRRLAELVKFCHERGMTVSEVCWDVVSEEERSQPELEALLRDTPQDKFDVVVVPSPDHLGFSAKEISDRIDASVMCETRLISADGLLDTWTPQGNRVRNLVLLLADQEQKANSGNAKLDAQTTEEGRKRPGRPRVEFDVNKVVALRKEGKSLREIAIAIGLGKSKVGEVLRSCPRQDASKNISGQVPAGTVQGAVVSPAACAVSAPAAPAVAALAACAVPAESNPRGDAADGSSADRGPLPGKEPSVLDASRHELLTVREASQILRMPEQTLRLWISQRRIPYEKLGRSVRLCRKDIQQFLDENRHEALTG
ncbi:MAG: recombinase family protein [Planctomycetota bacterium]|nr:recombinase family protein [Planctomycetota bacterium]